MSDHFENHDTAVDGVRQTSPELADSLETAFDGVVRDMRKLLAAEQALNREYLAALDPLLDIPDYDAGCLNDFGGGNVGWWQDYIRAEVGRANSHYRTEIDAALDSAPARKEDKNGS